MQGIIDEQGFRKDDPYVLARVAAYIRSAAEYSMDYDRAMDLEENVAVAFLQTYKQGICQHYASAATLLLRALNIPARYTVGYSVSASAGAWTDVMAINAHAWVEVYIKGAGWIQIEVTGDMGEEPEIPEDVTPPDDEEEPGQQTKPPMLVITPVDTTVLYEENGTDVLTPVHELKICDKNGNSVLDYLTQNGYTYTFELSGEQQGIGKTQSKIESFLIFDAEENDVSDQFELVFKPGLIHLYAKEITITSDSVEKPYDGIILLPDEKGYSDTGLIADSGHVIDITMTQRITDAGAVANQFKVVIRDAEGNDVSDMYKINSVWGVLRVTHREITITTASDTRPFDGTELTKAEYEMTSGTLCAGHDIEVVIVGTQTNIGYSDNTVDSVVISNAAGIDVTKNYSIKIVNGVLFVTPF